jgi:undecaprenyl-diphosphatase
MMAGFVSAYISGFLACRWMIAIVKRGKLIWFAVYCAIIGIVSILFAG